MLALNLDPPTSTSQMLGLQEYTSIPSFFMSFVIQQATDTCGGDILTLWTSKATVLKTGQGSCPKQNHSFDFPLESVVEQFLGWVWTFTSLIPAQKKLRQEDFKLRLPWVT